ncbi:MAG: hypothetical protein ACR2IR_05795 [Acidimicrobiia bacterium]
MDAWVWVVIVAAVVAVAVVGALVLSQRRRRARLQERFGPEYDRAVEGDRRGRVERDLDDRVRRREELDIRPLASGARERYAAQWHELQARFVDQPGEAVDRADTLVSEVMRERGYPVDDFDEQAGLVSVDHPGVVENYRTAHGVYVRKTQERASTEELREAVVAYRSLFEELLSEDGERADTADT